MTRTKKRTPGAKSARRTQATNTDSRSSSVGRKRPAPSSRGPEGLQQPANKRTKRSQSVDKKSKKRTPGSEDLRDFVPFSSLQTTHFAQDQGDMSQQRLGNNRLRSGFATRRIQRSASHPGTPSDSNDSDSPVVTNGVATYTIDSDDDDGGMTLNLDEAGKSPIVISDDDDNRERNQDDSQDDENSLEEGEAREELQPTNDGVISKANDDITFTIDPNPSQPYTHLKDLNSDQLENQMKYAYWHLRRDQIDLSRPAKCLHCQDEGHTDDTCLQKRCQHCGAFGEHESQFCPTVRRCKTCRQPGHQTCNGMRNTTIPCDICHISGHSEVACPLRHHPQETFSSVDKLQMWISCCRCASKSHFVGDCPKFTSANALRWSLRSLDPDQIVNISIQTGTQKLEEEAQNRGIRPEGLKIRGRASQHHADADRRDLSGSDSDDLENFLSHPPAPRFNGRRLNPPVRAAREPDNHHGRGNSPRHNDHYDARYAPRYDDRHERYDRYAAPSDLDTYRPPRNTYYATDSFGRPRSRSPTRRRDEYRPRGRSPSPARSHDSYRVSSRRSPPQKVGSGLPERPPPAVPGPGPGISIKLPTKKGLNRSLNSFNPAAQENLPSMPPNSESGTPFESRSGHLGQKKIRRAMRRAKQSN